MSRWARHFTKVRFHGARGGMRMLNEIEKRSEQIERSALESLHQFCPAPARDALGLKLIRVGDVSVAISSAGPSILINRALGLGTAGPATGETITQVVQTYRRLGSRPPRQAVSG